MSAGRRYPIAGIALCLGVLTAVSAARPQALLEGSGIPYGSEIGAFVSAPKGWIFDNQSGVSQGLHCVMYPDGSSWRTAREVIYVTFTLLPPGKTLTDHVENDAVDFRKRSPSLVIREEPPISLASGERAEVRVFTGDEYGNVECIAYVRGRDSVATFVLSCRSHEGFDRSIGPFKEMVSQASLLNVTSDGKVSEPPVAAPPTPPPAEASPGPGPIGRPSDGYSYWTLFEPGTFVSFRYALTSLSGSQEMLKTITLKDVSPAFVTLDYREAPPPSAGGREAGPASIYLRNRAVFTQAEEEFLDRDPLAALLGFDVRRYLNDPQALHSGEGREDLDWKGRRLATAWTRLRFGPAGAQTTVTIWFCDEVPGGLFRFVKEAAGPPAFREELVVEDVKAVRADPAAIERLSAGREPVTVEVPAISYVLKRFASLSQLTEMGMLKMPMGSGGADQASVVSPAEHHQMLLEIKERFDGEKRKVVAELGPKETQKLVPFMGSFETFLTSVIKGTGLNARLLDPGSALPQDKDAQRALAAELLDLREQIARAAQAFREAETGLAAVTIKFIKPPDTHGPVSRNGT